MDRITDSYTHQFWWPFGVFVELIASNLGGSEHNLLPKRNIESKLVTYFCRWILSCVKKGKANLWKFLCSIDCKFYGKDCSISSSHHNHHLHFIAFRVSCSSQVHQTKSIILEQRVTVGDSIHDVNVVLFATRLFTWKYVTLFVLIMPCQCTSIE